MLKVIDYMLDRTTMYRLVLYILIILLGISFICSFFGLIPYSPFSIIASTVFLIIISWAANTLFSSALKAPTNLESVYITALILALIISPAETSAHFVFLGWAGIFAMASKYFITINKKHIFNPAAIAVVLTTYLLGASASWWVGTAVLMPFVLIGGFLIIRKLRFEDLAWSFFTTSIIVSLGITLIKGGAIFTTLNQIVFHSSLIYMGSIMVTEPLTLPPTKKLQMIYGAIIGFLAVPQVHIGSIFFAPEVALCIGNVFAYIVSPKTKLILTLKEKIQVSSDIVDLIFRPNQKLAFIPGQYMEWTLSYPHPDSRGNRRYFTLASSPTEDTVRLGVKFYENGSSYKKAMFKMDEKTMIIGSQIAGEFTLPNDYAKKLVFIAGGIGITPFRSMLKYLIDTKQKRDIVLFYANKTVEEIVYKDVFDQAQKELNIKTVYTLTGMSSPPLNYHGKIGRINAEMIASEVPDYKERTFYLSGPHVMVTAYDEVLKNMGIKNELIKKDFFPGLV
jgi:ferredoxin-NADP reductase